jgi:hypothetical protein
VINSPEAAARAQDMTDRGVTLVKNDGGALPLQNLRTPVFWCSPGPVF